MITSDLWNRVQRESVRSVVLVENKIDLHSMIDSWKNFSSGTEFQIRWRLEFGQDYCVRWLLCNYINHSTTSLGNKRKQIKTKSIEEIVTKSYQVTSRCNYSTTFIAIFPSQHRLGRSDLVTFQSIPLTLTTRCSVRHDVPQQFRNPT